jgi:hypothetical protein
MRRIAPLIICLFLLVALVYSGDGQAQRRRTLVWKPRPAPSPTPIPAPDPHENILDQLPDATPTPTSKPTDDFFADIPDAEPEWSFILSQSEVTYAYNTRRIRQSDEGFVRVWFKRTLTGKARDNYLQRDFVRKLSAAGRDFTNYEYTLLLEDFDCGRSRWRKVNAVDYDRKGKVIFLYDFERVGLRWEEVIPNSVGEKLFTLACSHKE